MVRSCLTGNVNRKPYSFFFFFFFEGKLRGFDQTVNLILEGSHERVYSSTSGVEKVPLGLYIIRGDNV